MIFDDYRAYLAAVDEAGELRTVHGADLKSDVGAITEITAWSPEHPLVLFDEIDGYPGARIGVHSFDSYRRMQLIYGFPDGLRGKELTTWWRDRLDAYVPAPPVIVDDGPVLQNVLEDDAVDLYRFPAPVWHEHDGGPYLATGGASVLRDPESGRLNAGCYRGMLYDRNTIGHHLAGGHNGQVIRDRWFARGENCPVVISLGNDPSFTLAGAENVGFGQNELEFGGFLRGAPYEMIAGRARGCPSRPRPRSCWKARSCTRTASRSAPRARGARGWATTRPRSTSPPCGSRPSTTATTRSSWVSRRCASATVAPRAASRRPHGGCTCWSTPGWRASAASVRSARSWSSRSASTTRARSCGSPTSRWRDSPTGRRGTS